MPAQSAPKARAEKDKTTVFVRGLPFDLDEAGLSSVFSDVGPIKSCFLIKPKGASHHKGFGFVHYALPEDALRATEELNGKELGSRKLMVRNACLLHGTQ